MNSHQELFGGNIPQDVTGKQGENAIFIVYGLKQSDKTIKQVKDLCANFSALIRSMRNRFPEMQFSCTIGFGADAWKQLFPEQGNPKELKTFETMGSHHEYNFCFSLSASCKYLANSSMLLLQQKHICLSEVSSRR